jgi:hypothetical protein
MIHYAIIRHFIFSLPCHYYADADTLFDTPLILADFRHYYYAIDTSGQLRQSAAFSFATLS